MNLESVYRKICEDAAALPMGFSLNGRHYMGLPKGVFPVRACLSDAKDGVEKCIFSLDGGENLTIRLEIEYDPKYGAMAWTVYFENHGTGRSPVISDVDAADMDFAGEKPWLSGILGDHENNYAPYRRDLTGEDVRFYSDLGRPTHIYFPYFNLECGDGGCLIAIGWGGTWEASFHYDGRAVRFIGRGTNGLKTYLLPGECVRTPRMQFVPYEGRDEDEAMNKWRRWYIDRILPRDGGKPLAPFSTTWLAGDTGLPNSDGSISERYFTWRPSMEKMLSEGIKMDFRWLDAGWYVDPAGQGVPSDWWGTVGTWELDPEKWPGDSLKESTDFARENGMRTIMWFEPERVTHVDELVKNWGYKKEWALGDPNGAAQGNDIGQRECLDWTTERILHTLKKGGVEMYREDNNFDSRPCWAALDKEDRVGITENMAVAGHYEMWDRIIAYEKENGGCAFVDSCASGGGRNDLESMRRAVPLLRSDADRTTTSLRLSMTTAFDRWIPFCGASCTEQKGQLDPDGRRDQYIFRASYLPVLNLNAQWTKDPDTDFDMIRRGMDEWGKVKKYLLKDFYLLTPWHSESDRTGWTAFSYMDGDEGALFAFRMEECEADTVRLSMKKWAGEKHVLTDADTGEETEVDGAEFTVTRPEKRSAALYWVRKA